MCVQMHLFLWAPVSVYGCMNFGCAPDCVCLCTDVCMNANVCIDVCVCVCMKACVCTDVCVCVCVRLNVFV